MQDSEPPSPRPHSLVLQIGKDNQGNWIVRDPRGLCGGIFVDRAAALKYAMIEAGNRPQAVIMVPGVLELEFATPRARNPRAGLANVRNPLARVA